MRYPVIWTDGFPLKDWQGGVTIGLVIVLRPKYRNDEGIYQHELTHVKQGLCGLFVITALLYLLVPEYRLWAEVQAYRKQMQYGLTLDLAAWRLSECDRYDLGITLDHAKAALEDA